VLSESIPVIGQDFLNLVCTKIPDDKDFSPVFVHLCNMLANDDPHSTYHIENDLLFLWEGEQMCIPDVPKARMILLQEVHDSALAGHPGLDKMYTRLSQVAYWPNMCKHGEKYIKSCHTC
jgi:hypothetical protein